MSHLEPLPLEDLGERQQAILRLVAEQGFVTIEDLARRFSVSTQTVRRDIIRLDEMRLLQRFHGGAGQRESSTRLGYEQKLTVSADAKSRIADAVAARIPNGTSLFLDVGTTAEAIARSLRDHRRLHVVTASLAVAQILAGAGTGDIVVTGGLVRGADGSLVGDTAIGVLSRFQVDAAIVACSGFSTEGDVMDFDVLKVEVKQRMMANARRSILACDASKFGRTAVSRIAPLEAFDCIVTDQAPPPRLAEALAAAGCAVELA